MTNSEKNDLISLLICKQILGTITEEEQNELNAWRQANKYNEATFQNLINYDRLTVEHHRRKIVDYQRPMEDMKRRLAAILDENETAQEADAQRKTFSTKRTMYAIVSVAAVALLIFGATLFTRNKIGDSSSSQQTVVAQNQITPGTTQAMLTLSNGKTITLGSDAQQNSKAIRKAELHKGSEPQQLTLATPRGGEFKVTLEDGTEVWLNAESQLRYPETFDAAERRVEISGEAYFKVARDEQRPFYVVSGGQEVRVLGTEFNIHAYQDEAAVYTTLVSGSISLRPLHGKSQLVLTPGNQAVFSKDDAAARVHSVDTDVVTSWRSDAFVFEDQTAEQIMRTLSRWYDFQYEFADQQAAQTIFMGSIPRYGSFADVVSIFHKMGGIRIRQNGKKIVISSR